VKKLVSKDAERRALSRLQKRTARLSPDDRATVAAITPAIQADAPTPGLILRDLQQLSEKYEA
jgi:hypothetical protein